MIQLNVENEYDRLEVVVLGTANSCGGRPHLDDAYDPKTKEHIRSGSYPYDEDMVEEMEYFNALLQRYGVEVLRPTEIENLNQVFARDLFFVIDDKLVIPSIIRERNAEQEGLQVHLNQIPDSNKIVAPEGTYIEGGDVIIHNEYIFVGYAKEEDFYNYKTARTNEAGLAFIKKSFPHKKVIGFELNKSDYIALENSLHLDCCFQTLGLGHALIFEDGFRNWKDLDIFKDIFGDQNLVKVTRQEMYDMNCNVFSIAPDVVVSERGFIRVNEKLQSLGYKVEGIPYYQISKQEGLLRCSTLPLRRSK